MKQSGLIQAVAFSALLSLPSSCTYNQPEPYSYSRENQTTETQIQDEKPYAPKEKSDTRIFFEGFGRITLQVLSIAQYWIL